MTSRVDELTNEYIAAGVEPDKAKIQAAAQVAEEEKNDREVEQAQAEIAKVQAEAAKEAGDVAKTIEQSGGESVPISSEPAGAVPTGGVEPPVTKRVERPAPAAEEPVRGEEVPSGTVEPTTVTLYRGIQAGKEAEPTVGGGLFMSPDRKVAETYAGKDGNVKEEKVTFNNLLDTPTWADAKTSLGLSKDKTMADVVNAARDQGYDGVTFTTTNGREYIVVPQKETPSVTTPTETVQAKEEGAAAPVEGTEVAEFATTTEPPKVVKQPSGKNAAGESVKTLELSNGDKVQIIRRDNMWVREDDGVVTPVGKTLRDAIASVTGVAAEPLAKRGPKPKLTEEERATKAAEKKDWTSVLNFLERMITSTKKRVDTGEEGLAVQLDRFFGPRPETPEGPRKTYQTLFEERTLDNILKSKTSNPEALAVLRKNFYESIYPALEVLYDLSTRPQLATTRIKGMAEAQFNRAPVDIRNLIKTRVEGARAAPAPDIEQKITELAEEAPPVQTEQPTGPAPVVTVKKKKRGLEKP